MNRPPPNLADPAERRAYRRELMGVSKGLRRAGVALAAVGAGLIVANAWWRPIPNLVTWGVILIAFALMGAGIARRTRYHRARMRGAI